MVVAVNMVEQMSAPLLKAPDSRTPIYLKAKNRIATRKNQIRTILIECFVHEIHPIEPCLEVARAVSDFLKVYACNRLVRYEEYRKQKRTNDFFLKLLDDGRCGLHVSRLTFDMRGVRQLARPDVGRPFGGRVRLHSGHPLYRHSTYALSTCVRALVNDSRHKEFCINHIEPDSARDLAS